MKKIAIATLFFLLFTSNIFASSTERLFYLTADFADSSFTREQLQLIKDHAQSIDIIAPQIYQLDENGVIWGNMDSRLLGLAKEYHFKVMPLIVNTHFNQEQFHLFLTNPLAQERALSEMVVLCHEYHLYGLQFDFENIHINDKKAFTHFFQLAAQRLHQHGFAISVAVVPRTSDLHESDYDRWFFENWSGAYDYQALAQSSDFLSVMTYDNHTSLTTPGPLAPLPWVEKIIQGLLKKQIPAEKISLGIPTYSGYWFSGKMDPGNVAEKYSYRSREIQIAYSNVLNLLDQIHQPLLWQNQWKSSYVIYSHDDKNEYIFVEDAKSFQARLALVKRYHLRGLSVWKLGDEDPAIWNNKNVVINANSE